MKHYTNVVIFEDVVDILCNIYANKGMKYDIVKQVIYFSIGFSLWLAISNRINRDISKSNQLGDYNNFWPTLLIRLMIDQLKSYHK